MSAAIVDGSGWIAELQRRRLQDAAFGQWAHALLGLARKLQARGDLDIDLPAPLKWSSDRRARGETFVALTNEHRDWLVAQADLLKSLSADTSDPVGRCAKYFVDWLIWFWTADGCHPKTLSARRDAIKHDYTHLWSTPAARDAVDLALKRRSSPGNVVEHEHVVPKRRLISLIMGNQLSTRAVFDRFAHAAIVTTPEHKCLNKHFSDDMPIGWDPTSATADPFARYHAAVVKLIVEPPVPRP
jgi:hypothetical protein